MAELSPAGSEYGWRRRHWAGALGLRPPIAQHAEAEARIIEHHAEAARCAVEIGVAEGASAVRIRRVIDPEGELFLIDPFPAGRLGISLPKMIARRAVRGVRRGRVTWLRKLGVEAAKGWNRPIDFLLIGTVGDFEGIAADWEAWSPHVRVGGKVHLQSARVAEGSWVSPDDGPAKLVETVIADAPNWEIVDGAVAAVVVEKVSMPRTGRWDRTRPQHGLSREPS
jgi:Methyltransferase domain